MKIEVNSNGDIVLKEVYSGVLSEIDGQKLGVCMRDGAFEIGIKDTSIKSKEEYFNWYSAKDGIVQKFPDVTKGIENTESGEQQ